MTTTVASELTTYRWSSTDEADRFTVETGDLRLLHRQGRLFDAVANATVDHIIDAVPIDADDLPAYAGRLFDYLADNPDMLRVLTWAATRTPRLPRGANQKRSLLSRTARRDRKRSARGQSHSNPYTRTDPLANRKSCGRLGRNDHGLPVPRRSRTQPQTRRPAQGHHRRPPTDAHERRELTRRERSSIRNTSAGALLAFPSVTHRALRAWQPPHAGRNSSR
jgi:hypothetical protein